MRRTRSSTTPAVHAEGRGELLQGASRGKECATGSQSAPPDEERPRAKLSMLRCRVTENNGPDVVVAGPFVDFTIRDCELDSPVEILPDDPAVSTNINLDMNDASLTPLQSTPNDAKTEGHRVSKRCAVKGALCDLCLQSVDLGTEIWPIARADGIEGARKGRKGRYLWVHKEPCARNHLGGILVPMACPTWLRQGACDYGDRCFYGHEQVLAPQQRGPANSGQFKSLEGATPGRGWATKTPSGRKKIRNGNKCTVLRRWLLDTFGGFEGLRQGGVVDVAGAHPQSPSHPNSLNLLLLHREFLCAFVSSSARCIPFFLNSPHLNEGGSGELGFELVNLVDVPCLVVGNTVLTSDRLLCFLVFPALFFTSPVLLKNATKHQHARARAVKFYSKTKR